MPDRDDEARIEAQATLDSLRTKYFDAKAQNPQPRFDDLFDLRRAYEKAVTEYAGLEGRLLRDDILTSKEDLAAFRQIRERMAAAIEIKEIIQAAQAFIKLIVAVA